MGRVFLAYDPRLGRHVALKFVRGDDAGLTRQFLSEARAQAKVNHERVCRVYEVGEVEGRVFIAMQFIDGAPLSQLAQALTAEQKAMVIRDAAAGVHEAHRAGLIHRDLKPSNIMVEREEDGRPRPYVMDFGLARDRREGTTATGSVLGTPHYMSPEQARGEVARLDRRADVYSLGATLYFLLTGRTPIPGDNALEVLSHIEKVEPRPPRALEPGVPADLEAIVLKCLEKDRSARYDSARALAEDLERFLAGEPVQARRGVGYRLRRRMRKHRLWVSLGLAALLLVGLALGQAALTRRDAARREQLARRFTERVEQMEALARYASLSQLHDTREDRQDIQARMNELREEILQAGEQAIGAGHYALGRGHLVLGETAEARELLESSWRHGFHDPRVAYALALALGRQYQQRLLEAERLHNPAAREARKRDLERDFRAPALAWLQLSRGTQVPSVSYVDALLAYYEGRLDEALTRLDAADDRRRWFYEAPQLRGDILVARAAHRWNQGERELALADFEAGRKAYALAAATAESEPSIHRAMGELEHAAMVMALYGSGDVVPHFTRGQEAVARALVALPEDPDSLLLETRLLRRLAEYRMNHGGDVEEPLRRALETARRLMESRPDARLEAGRGYWLWGQYLQERGQDPREQFRQAAEAYAGVAPADRDYFYYANLGTLFDAWAEFDAQSGGEPRERRSKAIEAYRTAIALDGKVPDAHINLGIAWFQQASRPHGGNPDADLEHARQAFEQAQALNRSHFVPYYYQGELHLLRALRLRERGMDARPALAEALAMYQQGLTLNAALAQLHSGLGVVLLEEATEAWEHGERPDAGLARAQAAFEQAIARGPQLPFGYNNLGEAFTRKASYQVARGEAPDSSLREAEKALRRAIDKAPGSAIPWANLATVHRLRAAFELSRGRDPLPSLAEATEAVRAALERNPQSPQAWREQGETLGLRARWGALRGPGRAEDFDAAARAFERALQLAPERQEYRVALGHFCREWASWLAKTGQPSEATARRGLALVEAVLEARPGWPTARLLRATLRGALSAGTFPLEEQREWWRGAEEDFTQALASNPNLAPEWGEARERFRRLP